MFNPTKCSYICRSTSDSNNNNMADYMPRATNNLDKLGPHGWLCIYCFANGVQHDIKDTCDESTAICPRCGIDSCVPATAFNKKSLPEWRLWGFGAKYPEEYTQADIDNFMADVDHNAVDESVPLA